MSKQHEPSLLEWMATLLLSAAVILGIISFVWSGGVHAAENWCGQWAEGFETGYCWSKQNCDYIPPQICPAPKDGQVDGYIVGLKAGLDAGKN